MANNKNTLMTDGGGAGVRMSKRRTARPVAPPRNTTTRPAKKKTR